jgi:hypothetical protein
MIAQPFGGWPCAMVSTHIGWPPAGPVYPVVQIAELFMQSGVQYPVVVFVPTPMIATHEFPVGQSVPPPPAMIGHNCPSAFWDGGGASTGGGGGGASGVSSSPPPPPLPPPQATINANIMTDRKRIGPPKVPRTIDRNSRHPKLDCTYTSLTAL